jgi:hypothetical protein
MRRIVLLLMVLVMGSLGLHAQTYSADAEALASRFESLVSQMSAAQQMRDAKSIAVMRENIKNIRARAATLEDLRTKIAAAKDRVTAARQEWATAAATSERARVELASRMGEFARAQERLWQETGNFNVSWGARWDGSDIVLLAPEAKARFDAAREPYVRRAQELRTREQELARDETRVERLEQTTVRKQEAVVRAEAAVTGLEERQESRGVEFEQIFARNTNNLSRFAGLTPFSQNTATPSRGGDDVTRLIRKRPGTNTNALEQLYAQGARAANNCFDSSCEAVPMPRDNGVAAPAAVPQNVESHPAYRKASRAFTEAKQQADEAHARLRAAQRAGRPAEEQQRLTAEVTRSKGVEVMEMFKLKSLTTNLSFSIDVSSKAPKAAGSGQ